MALVAGVNIPDNLRLEYALRSIHGVGSTRAKEIIQTTAIEGNPRVRDLNDEELTRLRGVVERGSYLLEGDLRREVQMNIRRLVDIACYRGLRHRRGLPVRGQRTRTNARARRGRGRTIAGKKKQPRK